MASFPGRKSVIQCLYWFVWEYIFWDTGTLVMSYSICSMKGENKIFQGSCGKHKDKNKAGEGLPQWTLLHNSRATALSNLERCYTGDFISKISKQLFEIFPWATKDSLNSVTRIFTHRNFLLRWFNFNSFFFLLLVYDLLILCLWEQCLDRDLHWNSVIRWASSSTLSVMLAMWASWVLMNHSALGKPLFFSGLLLLVLWE